MTQTEPVLSSFALLLANGQENTSRLRQSLDKCSFCHSRSNLTPCADCGCVAYCGSEHQKFDWKKHKILCKTIQSKLSTALPNEDRNQLSYLSGYTGHQVPAALNYESGFVKATHSTSPPVIRKVLQEEGSGVSPSTSVPCSDSSPLTPVSSIIVSAFESGEVSEQQEIIIETDDPDIQIIEGPSTQSKGTPLRSRKRALLPKPLKDHSLNMAYSITPEEHRHFLMEQGRSFNQHQSAELRLAYIAEHILKSLSEFGWSVVDNFLGAEHCWHIYKEMRVLESRGLFKAGQVADGKSKDEQHLKDIRSDKTYWFEGTDEKSADACTIRMLVTYLDSIVHRFARRLTGNQIHGRSKPMLAIYPSNGSRYVKHVDNPSKDGRRITVIYYCNPKWNYKVDGGVLRLYPETSAIPLDIEPRADRLIVFWSDHRVPHEVMPVYKDRLAITVWYMDRAERDRHQGRLDPSKPTTSDESLAAVAPKVKDSKMDPTLMLQRARLNDMEADEGDSGKGASIHTTIQTKALSFRTRTSSHDSAQLSDDDDEDRLPKSDDMDPEFSI